MKIKRFTMIVGLAFIIVGILGFLPGFVHGPHVADPNLSVEGGYGRLFNLFPVNILHNAVHLVLGLWGVIAAKDVLSSRRYCRFTAVFYGALTIMGLFPVLNTVFGLIPIFSHDIWLHGIIAIATAYVGFAPARRASRWNEVEYKKSA